MKAQRPPRICDVEGCTEIVLCKHLCGKHYTHMRRGWPLKRKGESIPRVMEQQKPWTYEGRESELIAQYGGDRT